MSVGSILGDQIFLRTFLGIRESRSAIGHSRMTQDVSPLVFVGLFYYEGGWRIAEHPGLSL